MEPAELLFVDDSERNVEAARRLGFWVHHFIGPAAASAQAVVKRL